MREGWRKVRVSDVAQVIGGGTPKTFHGPYWDGDIPWITPKDLSDRPALYTAEGSRSITEAGVKGSGAQWLPAGTVLLSTRAPIGYVTIAARPLTTNQGFKSLVLADGQLPEYWYYLLSGSTEYLRSRAPGSTFPELSKRAVEALEFALPPVQEQRRIVDLMGHVDSLRTAISEEAARVFAALCAFRDSIWNVPQRVPLSQYCRVDGGLVDPTGEGQRDRPHVGTDRIVSGTGDLIGVQSASEDGVTSGKFEFSERHVVYSKIRPNLMKVAMPTFSGLCSADAYPLLPAPGVPRRWLQQLLLTTEFTTLAVSQSGRTKMPKINQSALMGLMVPDIADEAREEQAVVLDALDALRVGLGEELDALDRQRAAMLGSLLTGHHEIPCSYDEFIRDEGAA